MRKRAILILILLLACLPNHSAAKRRTRGGGQPRSDEAALELPTPGSSSSFASSNGQLLTMVPKTDYRAAARTEPRAAERSRFSDGMMIEDSACGGADSGEIKQERQGRLNAENVQQTEVAEIARKERDAKSKLIKARFFIDRGKMAAAQQHLEQIVVFYPGTEAAAEARLLMGP